MLLRKWLVIDGGRLIPALLDRDIAMDAKDSRQSKRRKCERRLNERRIVRFLFGSPEWRQNIQQQYLMWPRIDRRALDRRDRDRRNISRRLSLDSFKNNPRAPLQRYSQDILSEDEKTMLASLF